MGSHYPLSLLQPCNPTPKPRYHYVVVQRRRGAALAWVRGSLSPGSLSPLPELSDVGNSAYRPPRGGSGSPGAARSPDGPASPQEPPAGPTDPTPRREPFNDPGWLFEPKYDGYRGLLYVTRQSCYFWSKRGNIMKRFEQLCYWVREELPVKEAILDGEVVPLDSEGRQNFRDLLAGRGNLHYAAFDALWLRGRDLRGLPLMRRKRALTGLIPATTTVLSQVFSIEG